MKLQTALRAASWIAIILICFVTLSRVDMRPHLSGSSSLDRFGGFTVLGLLFCVAYPQRLRLVVVTVLGGAVALELLQLVTPDRDARLIDAAVKLAGGIAGITAGRWVLAATTKVCKAARRAPVVAADRSR
jgi:hypothetical protein